MAALTNASVFSRLDVKDGRLVTNPPSIIPRSTSERVNKMELNGHKRTKNKLNRFQSQVYTIFQSLIIFTNISDEKQLRSLYNNSNMAQSLVLETFVRQIQKCCQLSHTLLKKKSISDTGEVLAADSQKAQFWVRGNQSNDRGVIKYVR